MFETPFSLRRLSKPLSPKGPALPSRSNINIDLELAKLQLKLPKNRSSIKPTPQSPVKKGGLDNYNFCNLIGNLNTWQYSGLVSRKWDFYGSDFTGKLASLNFGLGVIKRLKALSGISYFHPRAFETTIGEILKESLFTELDRKYKRQRYFAPMNWQPINRYETAAVCFDVLGTNEPEKIFSFPISSTHIVWMEFGLSRMSLQPDGEDIDDWIKLDSMYELINSIIDSFQFELSGSSKSENEKVLADFGSKELVDSYPPLRWIDDESQFLNSIKKIAVDSY
jgi:hypothetical protein